MTDDQSLSERMHVELLCVIFVPNLKTGTWFFHVQVGHLPGIV